jgi:hypothetical protein
LFAFPRRIPDFFRAAPGGQLQLDRCISNYFNITLDKPLRLFVYPVSADSFSDLSTKLRQRFINTFLRNHAFPGPLMKENMDSMSWYSFYRFFLSQILIRRSFPAGIVRYA